jgi:hypothetical protein
MWSKLELTKSSPSDVASRSWEGLAEEVDELITSGATASREYNTSGRQEG